MKDNFVLNAILKKIIALLA